ncbi:MAG: hypothetical protein FJ335_02185 [Sphingomonadales bacterium]|nr:hypothetical protein [Sphingomonadales bacterium]
MRGLVVVLASAAIAVSPIWAQGRGNDGPPGKGGGGPEGKGRGAGDRGGPPAGKGGQGGSRGPERGPDRGGPGSDRGPDRRADRGGPGGPDRGGPGRDDRRGPGWDRADRGPPPPPGRRDVADARGWDGPKGKGRENRGPDGPKGRGWGPGDGPPPKGNAWGRRGRDAWFAIAPQAVALCPPATVRRGDACLLPARARRLWADDAGRSDLWYGRWADWRDDRQYDYRYDDGYLYRTSTGSNIISAILPLLGGALFGGNVWPQAATDYQVPAYYGDYFGYNDGLDYRYGDGAILGVNPTSGSIDGIAALLTGNQWAVGQAMPAGYDFYNVPPQFRDRYVDDAQHWYRYSDGQVYDVDPTTQIVRQIIQLVT